MMAIIAATGCAVDYGMTVSRRDEAVSGVDMATVAAAAAIKESTTANDNASRKVLATSVVLRFLKGSRADGLIGTPTVDVTSNGLDVTVVVTASGSVSTTLMNVFGYRKLDFSIRSTSVATISPYVDVTLLVDTSGSMALGATAADIQRLRTQFGCAFACHDNPVATVSPGPRRTV